ncbi:hypothetical protein M409DRAFT_61628 [Zasmidium cellare ATCC 36951]|uniref:Heterokaryon incompatibility domain-containing protein n=1 Tax=Zasmidium cellare ATCC 36951 TaxID=1080233 RepID=A0A6A6BY64_ZASCE|nr:uncharacterized protein M409DRAFT_61628 [Zasmidium cellare ATCC 36951]KAF2158469.1 hypothetical protein M409DRAFT_61628 [Zasmidium cellare ATCC 36951]
MATNVREPDDRQTTISRILHQRNSNLVSELLDIQNYAMNVGKAHKWVQNPLCLRFRRSSPRTFQGVRNRNLEQRFVALSWTWDPSTHESDKVGNYWVEHSHTGEVVGVKVRNCIIDRATKYLLFTGFDIFWIDRICINQDDQEEKQEAMNSMDLIYKHANKSVALLSTPIRSQSELCILVRLVSGEFAFSTGGHCKLSQSVSWTTMKKAMQVLRRITKDSWWTRAWTLQEEYVAGVKMDILLPLGPGVGSIPGSGDIPGEYCVSATHFRTQATIFLEACLGCTNILKQQANRSWTRYKTLCLKTRNVVAKYNIILAEPMSARIHADVGRRNITRPWDSLAIIANSCGYGVRLDGKALLQRKQSLSLSLLTQYLLNGEITCSDWHAKGFLDFSVDRLLQKATLASWKLPDISRQLTFLKHCRFGPVEIYESGVRTSGLLWELKSDDRIRTSTFDLPKVDEITRMHLQKSPWKSMELYALTLQLQRNHHEVALRLERYIQGRRSGHTWTGSGYMDLMAWDLIQAVQQGYVLRIGYLKNTRAGSIFIPELKDIWRPMHVFSTWYSGQMHEYQLDKYVSTEVSIKADGVLGPLKWVRGLLLLHETVMYSITLKSF